MRLGKDIPERRNIMIKDIDVKTLWDIIKVSVVGVYISDDDK